MKTFILFLLFPSFIFTILVQYLRFALSNSNLNIYIWSVWSDRCEWWWHNRRQYVPMQSAVFGITWIWGHMDRGKEEKGKGKEDFLHIIVPIKKIMPCLFYIKPFKFRGIWFGIQCGLGRRQNLQWRRRIHNCN